MEIIEHISDLPALNNDVIHVWGARVPDVFDRLDALKAPMSAVELAKAARFHRDSDRHSSIVARGALRILLSGYTGVSAAEIRFDYLDTGKPYVASSAVAFSVSHAGEWVVLAFGRGRTIGVDVESIRRSVDVLRIAARYFTPEEVELIESAADRSVAFFNLWTRKEAYVKARGSALFRELSTFAVPFEDGEKDGWFFRGLEAGGKHAAAVVTDKPVADMPCFDFGGLKWDS